MTEDEHKVCDLEMQIAVLKQKSEDDDKALTLARDINSAQLVAASAHWRSNMALILTGVVIVVMLITLFVRGK
jgi:hypothetical protein